MPTGAKQKMDELHRPCCSVDPVAYFAVYSYNIIGLWGTKFDMKTLDKHILISNFMVIKHFNAMLK